MSNGSFRKLEYQKVLDLAPGEQARAQTTQAPSLLQLENLSRSDSASYFVGAGQVMTQAGTIPANTAKAHRWTANFGGALLTVSNTSTRQALLRVALLST